MNTAIIGASERYGHAAGRVLRAHGVRGRHLRCGSIIGYEYALPTSRAVYRARAFIAPPMEMLAGEGDDVAGDDIIGRSRRAKRKARRKARRARLKRRLKGAVKRVGKKLKKFVKSKALSVLKKVGKKIASFIPYGSAVVATAEGVAKAARAIKKARVSGDPALVRATVRALDEDTGRMLAYARQWS